MSNKLSFWFLSFYFILFSKGFLSQGTIEISLLNLSSISTFDKVELGVKLPKELEEKIQQFIKSENAISFKTSEASLINPFDPKQLDIQFDFWKESETKHYKRFGFYYEAFSNQNGRVVPVGSSSNFRVRFTPKETGIWNSKAIVIINKDTLMSNLISFECIPTESSKEGFLEISNNEKYFKIYDSSFFPVGQNIPWPGGIWYNNRETLPHKDYEKYHRLVKQLKDDGGNYFRMLITPWTYDIEFETLGNYSKRMSNAWELDQLINFTEKENLKIHFNMMLHGALENPSVYTITNWDWPAYEDSVYKDKTCVDPKDEGFCYKRELGLKHPVEFFTDYDAKRFYKNKLRYMIARWGYSTSIGVLELFSEINNAGQQGNLKNTGNGCPNIGTIALPYRDYQSVPKIVLAWQNEMARYIKEELSHTNHPISVSYTGRPDIKNGDLSYYSPYVDIATYNSYSFDPKQNKFARLTEELNTFRANNLQISNTILRKYDTRRSVKLTKPFMLSEIGSGLSDCADNTEWKQSVFLSPFTGLSGVGMPWLNYDNNQNLWRYFAFVNRFMNAVNLSDGEWESNYAVSKSNKVELYSLVSEEREVIGAINNRTNNYFTNREDCKSCFCANDTVVSSLRVLETIVSDNKENQLKLKNLGMFKKYKASFFNPYTGIEIKSQKTIKTNFFGQLIIIYPELLRGERPIIYFKLGKE